MPKHTLVQVECRVQSYRPKEETLFIFKPDINSHWAEGLEFCETTVILRPYTSPHIIVSVQNPTDNDLTLTGKTVIGTVQKVQAVYPAAVLEGPG